MPNNTNCSRHCAFKLSGFMDHNNVDVKSLNLCVNAQMNHAFFVFLLL